MNRDEIHRRVLDRSWGAEMLSINRACPIVADFTFFFDRSPDFFRWPSLVFDDFRYVGLFHGQRLVGYVMVGFRVGWTGVCREPFFYVGDARLLPAYRGLGLMQETTRLLEEQLPKDVRMGFFLVKEGNLAALGVLRKVRPAAYAIRRLCRFDAFNLPLLFRLPVGRRYVVRRAAPEDAPRLARFIEATNAGRLFARQTSAEDLAHAWTSVPGSACERYYIAERNGRLCGVLGVWDMEAMHRATVLAYSRSGALMQRAYGLAAGLLPGAAPLPAPGEAFRALTATHVAATGPEVLRSLLAVVVNDHLGRGYHLLHIGFAEGDPLRRALRWMPHHRFRSVILMAGAPEALRTAEQDAKPPSVDLSMV